MYSRGTSVDVQADRDDSILNLPAGSSVTLTFTIAATVASGEPDGGERMEMGKRLNGVSVCFL